MKQPARQTTYLVQKSAAFWAAQVNHNRHLRMALEDSDPHELIQRLYNNLQDHLDHSLIAVENGDLAGKSKWLTLSLLTVNTLKVTLKFEWHPRLAENLAQLYEYIARQLSWGLIEPFNTEMKNKLAEQLHLIRQILAPLVQAWKELTETAKEYRMQHLNLPEASG
jgi:flagellin-specific chaperone FliS